MFSVAAVQGLRELFIGRPGDHGENLRLQAQITHLGANLREVVHLTADEDPLRIGAAHLGSVSALLRGQDLLLTCVSVQAIDIYWKRLPLSVAVDCFVPQRSPPCLVES